jgi:hypothetical protein
MRGRRLTSVSLFSRPGVLLLACDFKTDRFQAFVGAFSRYLGERVAEYDARGEVENGRRATHDATTSYVRKLILSKRWAAWQVI